MDNEILNLEQACIFLGVSERTLIKLLKEEHIPARKIGREWRFSKRALIDWVASGDCSRYSNQDDIYAVYEDSEGTHEILLDRICTEIDKLKNSNDIKSVLKDLKYDIPIPSDSKLSISYKQKRDVEKLEFKIYWMLRDEYKINEKNTEK